MTRARASLAVGGRPGRWAWPWSSSRAAPKGSAGRATRCSRRARPRACSPGAHVVLARRRARLRAGARSCCSRCSCCPLVQFHAFGGRIGGDGVIYYVYVRSLVKDADLDFTNEYTHYGLIDRGDLTVPTRDRPAAGRSSRSGPGWPGLPFFAARARSWPRRSGPGQRGRPLAATAPCTSTPSPSAACSTASRRCC